MNSNGPLSDNKTVQFRVPADSGAPIDLRTNHFPLSCDIHKFTNFVVRGSSFETLGFLNWSLDLGGGNLENSKNSFANACPRLDLERFSDAAN